MIEALEEVDVTPSALAIASCVNTGSESMKTRRGILHMLVTPEPRSAGQVHEQVGVGAEAADALARDPVVFAIEVDERTSDRPAEGSSALLM